MIVGNEHLDAFHHVLLIIGEMDRYARAIRLAWLDRAPAAQFCCPLTHGGEPNARPIVVRQTLAIIGDFQAERPSSAMLKTNVARPGLRMPGDIGQRFQRNAIRGNLNGSRQWWQIIWSLDKHLEIIGLVIRHRMLTNG